MILYSIKHLDFKQLKVHQTDSAACRIFNSLLSFWECGETRSSVFDILHENEPITASEYSPQCTNNALKGAVSRQSSSFCVVFPITRP